MKNLLIDKIEKIQEEYADLLKELIPQLENDKYVHAALDSIAIFWRRRKDIIDLFLRYVVCEKNAYIYTAATYFDVCNGEQYPFLLMGDIHIFDDPLGRYCEICYLGNAPERLSERVLICAKDNMDILTKCNKEIVVLPLRFMGTGDEEKEFLKIGEQIFLDFFPRIKNMESYFNLCKDKESILKYLDLTKSDMLTFDENDFKGDPIADRINKALEMAKRNIGEGFDDGSLFYFAVYGPLQQAIDIILLSLEYNCIPLLRYPVALNYVLGLLPNFSNKMEINGIIKKTIVINSVYKMFNQEVVCSLPLARFGKIVKEFKFEELVLHCFDELYENANPTPFLEECLSIVENFQKYCVEAQAE